MAVVDFTNARLEVVTGSSYPPVKVNRANLYGNNCIKNSSGTSIASVSLNQDIQSPYKTVFKYTGTFTASGTEFYIFADTNVAKWKVSNISFQSGDTFNFNIPVTITCN